MSSSPLPTPSRSSLIDPARTRIRRFGRWLLVGTFVIAAAAVLWKQVLEDRLIAKRFGVVVPGKVYRSGQISRHLIERTLTEHKIQTVVDMQRIDPQSTDQQAELQAVDELGVELVRCPLAGDGTGDVRNYARAVATLATCEREGRPVLIHCAAGSQRTGGAVAAYRMLVRGDSPEVVYAELQEYDWQPESDQELVRYLNAHMAQLAQLLVQMGVIERVPEQLPRLPEQR